MNIAGAVSSMMGNAMSAVNTIKTSFKKQQIEKAKAQADILKELMEIRLAKIPQYAKENKNETN